MSRVAGFAGFLLAGLALLVFSPLASATQLSLGAAAGFNVFTFSNFNGTSDAQGRVAVGGDFNTSGFTVASNRASDGRGVYDLVVGGSLTESYYSVGGGDVFVGGNLNWTTPTAPHDIYVNGNVNNSGWGSVGGTIYYNGTYSSTGSLNHTQTARTTSPIDFLAAKTDLRSLSTTLASQTANGTVSLAYSTYTLTGVSSSVNVFNLSASSYNGTTINITAPSGSTVIVNVAGTADSFNAGSINLNGIPSNNVIFNFSSATTLALASIDFNATILAPFATFSGSGGNVDGQLIANSVTGSTEFHDYLFNGSFLAMGGTQGANIASPEPGTWVSLFSGGLLIAIAVRRRSGKA